MPLIADAVLSIFLNREARRELHRVRARQKMLRRLRQIGLIDREALLGQLRLQARLVQATESERSRTGRAALIEQAKHIRRSKQGVFDELDPEQRRKLRKLAQTVMGTPKTDGGDQG